MIVTLCSKPNQIKSKIAWQRQTEVIMLRPDESIYIKQAKVGLTWVSFPCSLGAPFLCFSHFLVPLAPSWPEIYRLRHFMLSKYRLSLCDWVYPERVNKSSRVPAQVSWIATGWRAAIRLQSELNCSVYRKVKVSHLLICRKYAFVP